jgi:hypothetical protein
MSITSEEGSAAWQALADKESRRGRGSAALLRLQVGIEALLAACTDRSVEGAWIDLSGRDKPIWISRGSAYRRADAAEPVEEMDAMDRVDALLRSAEG